MTEPTDAELAAFAVEEEFLLFCSDEEFLQIARAVLAKWGTPAFVGVEPYAQHAIWHGRDGDRGWDQYHDSSDPMPLGWDGDAPDEVIDLYTAAQAQAGAGEPYAYAVYFPDQPTEELVHDLDELCDDLTNREHTITKLYATPQPTQAQAGAVPLTDERLDAAVEAWFGSDNNYDFRERMRAAIDSSHGIKGGQHGDSTA